MTTTAQALDHLSEMAHIAAILTTRCAIAEATRFADRTWCAKSLLKLRAEVAHIPELAAIVDRIVADHAPELLEGDEPLYRLS